MLQSDTAIRLCLDEQFTPPQIVIDNLGLLCNNVLEPLRSLVQQPIYITSGYRCPRLNSAIGGAMNSQHIVGQAADTHINNMTVQDWYEFVKQHPIFDQLIQEFNQWVHVSYNASQRDSCLIATKVNGITVYTPDK